MTIETAALATRLLRASGDRPKERKRTWGSRVAPPRERRSTHHHHLEHPERGGSSARAEIDP